MADDLTGIKVDVGVLKEQINTLTILCNKMDIVIEKLMSQHERHITKIYTDMDNRRLETDKDIHELHDRIDTVLDKMQDSESRIMDEIKCLREDIKEEKKSIDAILAWKWQIVGGIIAISWLISHSGSDIIGKVFNH